MIKTTRGWPPSRRRAQAETIRRTRPWTRSTGPRTAAGKATCARNGYRRSLRSPTYLQFRALLRWQYRTTRAILKGLPPPPLPLSSSPRRRGSIAPPAPSSPVKPGPTMDSRLRGNDGVLQDTTVSFDSQRGFG
jgi:hypothetical protein